MTTIVATDEEEVVVASSCEVLLLLSHFTPDDLPAVRAEMAEWASGAPSVQGRSILKHADWAPPVADPRHVSFADKTEEHEIPDDRDDDDVPLPTKSPRQRRGTTFQPRQRRGTTFQRDLGDDGALDLGDDEDEADAAPRGPPPESLLRRGGRVLIAALALALLGAALSRLPPLVALPALYVGLAATRPGDFDQRREVQRVLWAGAPEFPAGGYDMETTGFGGAATLMAVEVPVAGAEYRWLGIFGMWFYVGQREITNKND